MTRPQGNAFGAFEIEAGTPERFLKLLKDREEERALSGPRSSPSVPSSLRPSSTPA
jgi:hypothetical protein